MITDHAQDKISKFNKMGLHYNLVASAVYEMRKSLADPFAPEYLPYLIAALVSFDMGRMMGPNSESRYDTKAGRFATILETKLGEVKPYISHLVNLPISELSIHSEAENIIKAYDILSTTGEGGLNQKGGGFHVGTTKILHFLNPEGFIIVDSNAARAFKLSHNINFKNSTQPGYSSYKYIKCMEAAEIDILNFGIHNFCALDGNVPIARIYDKLTFVTGSKSFDYIINSDIIK